MIIQDELSEPLFMQFGLYVEETTGIKMPPQKRTMLAGRLMRRMRGLQIPTFQEYYDYVFSPQGSRQELGFLIDAVTTNKTDFFREKKHFDLLSQQLLAELVERYGNRLRFWSAPCSRGHEPYTLAMVVAEYALDHPPLDFWVLGSDLSSQVLEVARRAVYPHEAIVPVPMPLRKRYLLRGKDHGDDVVKVIKPLRDRVTFQQMNFMDETYPVKERFHVVFCRNMLIYFQKQVQEQVIRKIAQHMVPGGYLVMGHSETLSGLDVPVRQVSGTLYRLPAAGE